MDTDGHKSEKVAAGAFVPIRVHSRSKTPWRKCLLRTLSLLLVVVIGATVFVPPFLEKRTERRVRAMLLAVQEALQRYHVKEELYPKRMMEGHELAALLVSGGHLDESLANPWTGRPYHSANDEDWLRYRTDSLAETYELTVLSPGTERVQFRLDSTKNQSLE